MLSAPANPKGTTAVNLFEQHPPCGIATISLN
jgi:hypothetical protein